MKLQFRKLLPALLFPLAVGGLSAFLTMESMETFSRLNQPALSPPGWLFPVVWTLLYLLMGFASYLVFLSDASRETIRSALTFYGIQLFFNFYWSVLFFNQSQYLLAFFWLLLLELLILLTTLRFREISRLAGWLLVPYLVWVAFAGYLNLGIYLLNR